jgi:hypothetical protein
MLTNAARTSIQATTNRPACSGLVGTANLKTVNVDICTVLGPSGALEVHSQAGVNE